MFDWMLYIFVVSSRDKSKNPLQHKPDTHIYLGLTAEQQK